jgi:hypothetical protein
MYQTEIVGQDLNLSASFHSEIARVPMASRENIGKSPLNSDYEEKLLLDELISTQRKGERTYISNNHGFTYIHEKTRYSNICQTASGASCENNEKSFRTKAYLVKNEGRVKKCLLRR